jgi:type VI protein secretion system component VasK
MTLATWILFVLGVVVLCLDAIAMRKVLASSLYSPAQLWAQAALILGVPVLGASLALYMCRENLPLFQRRPVDHLSDIDSTTSDIDYHG